MTQNYPDEYTNIITYPMKELSHYRILYSDSTISNIDNVSLIINSINAIKINSILILFNNII